MRDGILYVATGARHFAEARASAISARQHMPDLPIVLVTDQPQTADDVFTQVIALDDATHTSRDKIVAMQQLPFDRTLFIDTDTRICADLREIFALAERFTIALTHDIKRLPIHDPQLPAWCFPEFNSGVLMLRRGSAWDTLVRAWLEEYDAMQHPYDQPALRRCLYRMDIRFSVLPMMYNARYLSAGLLAGPAKIVHGRVSRQYRDIDTCAAVLNRSQTIRAFIAGKVYAFQYGGTWFAGRVVRYEGNFSLPRWFVSVWHLVASLRERGPAGTWAFIRERYGVKREERYR